MRLKSYVIPSQRRGILMIWLLFLFISVTRNAAWGAACCVSGSSAPSLLTGNDQSQISLGANFSSVIGNSYKSAPALFLASSNQERTAILFLSGTSRLASRWQIHVDLPFSLRKRSVFSDSSSHESVGDIVSGLAFEAIEELEYNPWKPRLLIFADIVFPTGRSVYESRDSLGADIHGKGFFAGQFGLYFWKAWDPWDASILFSYRKAVSREFEGIGLIDPGNSLFASLSVGFKFLRRLHVGFGLGPGYDSKMRIDGVRQQNSDRLVWNVSGQAVAALSDQWKFNLSYSDQTLLGPTFNTTLSRGILFSAIRTFEL